MEGNSLDSIEDSALALYEVQSSIPTSHLVAENLPVPMLEYGEGSAATDEPVYQMVNFLTPDLQQPSAVGGQQVAAFQTLDGQLVYVTYTLQPDAATASGSETDDVCAESAAAAMTLESLAKGLLLHDHVEQEEEQESAMQPTPSKRKPVEPVVGSEVGIEEKLEVRDAMLDALPVRKNRKQGRKPDSRYDCDLCSASFPQAAQLFGHLHSHTGERKFPCLMCAPGKAVFSQAARLANHERRFHTSVRQFVCDTCGDSFDRVSQMQYHMRRIHLLEKPFACQICSKGFFKKSDLKTHLNVHLGITTHTCPTCGKHFSHVSNLTRHVRTHTGIKPYVCSDCGRRFAQPSAVKSHKAAHHNDRRDVSCLVCTMNFKTLPLMRRHVRHSHPAVVDGDPKTRVLQMKTGPQIRRYYCSVCGDSFQFATQLHSHELLHAETIIQCSGCQAQLSSIDHLKSHTCEPPPAREPPQTAAVEQHAGKEEPELLGEIVIYVSQEGQIQPTQVVIKPVSPNMDEALLLFEDDQLQSSPALESQADGDGIISQSLIVDPVECLETKQEQEEQEQYGDQETQVDIEVYDEESRNFILPDVSDLDDAAFCGVEDSLEPPALSKPNEPESSESPDQDQTTSPVHTKKKRQQKIYHCSECGKQFIKNSNYKQHLGIHFVHLQKYACSVCGRVFAWRSTLNKHMVQHNTGPTVKYSCELCERQYPNSFQVQEHVKRDHNKERTHACSECDKVFYKRYDLKLHTRTHTKEKPYMCGVCGKCFYHPSHILRHERTHSGVRPYVCQCGRKFSQASSLQSHRLAHHPSGAE